MRSMDRIGLTYRRLNLQSQFAFIRRLVKSFHMSAELSKIFSLIRKLFNLIFCMAKVEKIK